MTPAPIRLGIRQKSTNQKSEKPRTFSCPTPNIENNPIIAASRVPKPWKVIGNEAIILATAIIKIK